MSEQTNATTADLATQRAALPLRSLQLIGIFGPTETPRALLRTAGGQIRNVGAGDRVSRFTVQAIAEDRVILKGTTGEQVLRLPDAPRAAA